MNKTPNTNNKSPQISMRIPMHLGTKVPRYGHRLVHIFNTSQCRSAAVPPHNPITPADLNKLEDFIGRSKRLLVMGGAGLSTESGIKDYRSEKVGHFATTDQRPTKYGDFLKSSKVRQKYWARNATAWPLFKTFKPNKSHKYLATLEHMGILHWLVTQNVDNLHHEAGSRLLTELHGTVFSVICLDCKLKQSRDEVQDQIHALNPSWEAVPQGFAPDADVFISDELVESFNVPHCTRCGGTLKPDVVFFGDNIPLRRVRAVSDKVAGSDAMMIVGSSLETYSAMRHVMEAKKLNIPILILNIGRTRADLLADTIITARCGEAFSILLDNHIPK